MAAGLLSNRISTSRVFEDGQYWYAIEWITSTGTWAPVGTIVGALTATLVGEGGGGGGGVYNQT